MLMIDSINVGLVLHSFGDIYLKKGLSFNALAPTNRFKFYTKMSLSFSENFVIACVVLAQYQRVTDEQKAIEVM